MNCVEILAPKGGEAFLPEVIARPGAVRLLIQVGPQGAFHSRHKYPNQILKNHT
jgi:hypothetical protein